PVPQPATHAPGGQGTPAGHPGYFRPPAGRGSPVAAARLIAPAPRHIALDKVSGTSPCSAGPDAYNNKTAMRRYLIDANTPQPRTSPGPVRQPGLRAALSRRHPAVCECGFL